jgi:hypothetical protein
VDASALLAKAAPGCLFCPKKNHATDQQRRFGISTEHVRSFVCVSKEPNQLFKVSESIEAITLKLSIAVVESFAQI